MTSLPLPLFLLVIIAAVIVWCCLIFILIIVFKNIDMAKNQDCDDRELESLSSEPINDIHSREKITPLEKVSEWERLGLCAPGDAIGSASDRCEKFKTCHDCLVDYANKHSEYEKFEFRQTRHLFDL